MDEMERYKYNYLAGIDLKYISGKAGNQEFRGRIYRNQFDNKSDLQRLFLARKG